MAAFSKVILSGSTNGRPVSIVEVATLGDLLHTAHATSVDEIWLYAVNRHTAAVLLTVEFGGVVAGDLITSLLAVDEPKLILPGLPLTNSLAVSAFAAVTGVVSVFGWVNRIG